jgi:predicted phosphoribosyltransferase
MRDWLLPRNGLCFVIKEKAPIKSLNRLPIFSLSALCIFAEAFHKSVIAEERIRKIKWQENKEVENRIYEYRKRRIWIRNKPSRKTGD